MLLSALSQNLVQFTLRPGVQVTVYAAHHSAGKQTQIPLLTFETLGLLKGTMPAFVTRFV